jgi:hypothetical protein
VPLAAAAAALLVIGISVVDRAPAPGGTPMTLPAWTALPPVDEDEGLLVVSGFAEDGVEGLEWSDLEEGRGLGAFVASLSEDESEALIEALRAAGPEGSQ